ESFGAKGSVPYGEADRWRGVGRQGREEVRPVLQDSCGLGGIIMSAANLKSVPLPEPESTPPVAQATRRRNVPAADSSDADPGHGYVRTRAPEWLQRAVAMALGLASFVAVWAGIAHFGGQLPSPAATLDAALALFADPFYNKGPNDQGIGW